MRIPARLLCFRRAGAVVALALAWTPAPGVAQLISPGRLSSAHAGLEGIRNCTQCHELRKSGISPSLCLSCHEPLARRIQGRKGFHATLPDQACATCHKEHLGADFALVRLDTLSFDHTRTGYALDGAHVTASCRACHAPANVADAGVRAFKTDHGVVRRTFLGLSSRCAACHEADAPHAGQFADRACSDCHDTQTWKEAGSFDHDRAPFPLTGEHRSLECGACHAAEPRPGTAVSMVRYLGVRHEGCADCHEDRHRGAMPGRCEGCHDTSGWKNLDRKRLESSFDHRATGFALVGRHAGAPCAACHGTQASAALKGIHVSFKAGTEGHAFPRPLSKGCLACHEDEHAGAMPGACEACHTQSGWRRVERARLEASFQHDSTGFALEGRHTSLSCASCHHPETLPATVGIEITYAADTRARAFPRPETRASGCLSCHQDRHRGVFTHSPGGADCAGCHGQAAWLPTGYDVARHNRDAGFRLEGAHAVVACAECHTPSGRMPSFRQGGSRCETCHQEASPHGDQFEGRSCDACHGTDSFRIAQFAHDTTLFPLDGAHARALCGACHTSEPGPSGIPRIRYRPLGTECRSCHGGRS
jgi:hypothetical protein